MDYNQRKEVIDKLNHLEARFSVEDWKMDGIHVWPIFKMILFFHESDKQVTGSQVKKSRPFDKGLVIAKKARRLLTASIQYFRLRLPKADFVFVGADTYRVMYEGRHINRFFDPIITYLEGKRVSSIRLEYSSSPSIKDPSVKLDVIAPIFKPPFGIKDNTMSGNELEELLSEIARQFNRDKSELLTSLQQTIRSTVQWRNLFRVVFKQVKPRYSFGLCYYSSAMWGMNVAARELGIITVDMQHGGQGELHAAYTFIKVPKEGYNVLPNEFWCWDQGSVQHLLTWINGSSHQAKLSGNPWYEFLSANKPKGLEDNTKDRPMILYTHQPLMPIFDQYMLEVIRKTKNQYHWWIRLHPRTTEQQKMDLLKYLQDSDVLQFVEIEKATDLPLPELLSVSALHLSKFSGSIIEAAGAGVFSVILEEIGVSTFKDIIDEGKAVGMEQPKADPLIQLIAEVINIKVDCGELSFKGLLDDMVSSNVVEKRP